MRLDHASIPGSTPLTMAEQEQLIPALSTKEQLNEWERANILEASQWAFNPRAIKRRDPLTEAYVRELHQRMFQHTWKWAGRYRQTARNLGVSPHEIISRIAASVGDTRYQIENRIFDLDEIAIRFHHRLVWIHPFPNGNGRHARLLTDVLLIVHGREPFSWGARELIAVGPARNEYIRCLRAADADPENIQGLLRFARS